MPSKPSKNKTSSKSEKTHQPTRKLTSAQIVFGVFAVLLILSMVLSLVSKF